jgi:hypothetical protein
MIDSPVALRLPSEGECRSGCGVAGGAIRAGARMGSTLCSS